MAWVLPRRSSCKGLLLEGPGSEGLGTLSPPPTGRTSTSKWYPPLLEEPQLASGRFALEKSCLVVCYEEHLGFKVELLMEIHSPKGKHCI